MVRSDVIIYESTVEYLKKKRNLTPIIMYCIQLRNTYLLITRSCIIDLKLFSKTITELEGMLTKVNKISDNIATKFDL